MFESLLKPSIRHFILRSAPWVIVAIIGLIMSLGSGYSAYKVWSYEPYVIIPSREPLGEIPSSGSALEKRNTVEISGAVTKPGVYQVNENSRWQEVLLMANGFDAGADRRFIHQELNLAEKVKDQQKLYVPFASESAQKTTKVSDPLEQKEIPTTLMVNTAEAKIWDEVPGIGEARVASILKGVPYLNKEDFIARSGISMDIYKSIEEKYTEIVY